eukprot:1441_1
MHWVVLLSIVALAITVSSKSNYLFHGKQHAYNHDVAKEKQDIKLYRDNKFHSHLPIEFTHLFEYNIEFQDNIVMIQLDHDEITKNIKYIECQNKIKTINVCFTHENVIDEFMTELENEIGIDNNNQNDGDFIIASSNENQWINCRENIKETSLIRQLNINSCIEHNNCLQCTKVQPINHNDLIKNGFITFHSDKLAPIKTKTNNKVMLNNNNNNIKHNNIYNHKRQLNQIDRTYSVDIDVCAFGGTTNDIWIVIEGFQGDKTTPYNAGKMSDGGVFPFPTGKWYYKTINDIDIGIIEYIYFISYGDVEFCVEELSVDGEKWDDELGLGCECLEYTETYPGGCEVVRFDIGGTDILQRTETPCEIIPVDYGDLLSERTYTVRIDVCDLIGFEDGTKDIIYLKIEGTANITDIHPINLRNSGQSFAINFNDVDVAFIKKIYLITFGDDQYCI